MKIDFHTGQLVRHKVSRDIGLVVKVERDYYGARQAFKIYGDIPKESAIRPDMVNGIGPTKDGIRDKVMVKWYTNNNELHREQIDIRNSVWHDGNILLLLEDGSDER